MTTNILRSTLYPKGIVNTLLYVSISNEIILAITQIIKKNDDHQVFCGVPLVRVPDSGTP